jgi:hypothetical protein
MESNEHIELQAEAIYTWLASKPGWQPRLMTYAKVFALAAIGSPCTVPAAVPRAVAALITIAPELRSISISETVHYSGDIAVRVHFSMDGAQSLPCWLSTQ